MNESARSYRRWGGPLDLVHALRYMRQLRLVRRLGAMPPDELARFQLERLRDIVTYAYENVELYRVKWNQAGVRPEDIRTLTDIEKFPMVTKADFRRGFPHGIVSRQCRPHQRHLIGTSGSTGSPVSLFVDTDKALLDFAVNLPCLMAGRRAITALSGVRDYLFKRNIRQLFIVVSEPRAYESLQGRLFPQMRHTVVDSLLSSREHLRAINRKRPQFLMTYPSVLRNLCLEIRASGRAVHQPEVIMVVGEVLDESLRALAGQTFSAELMDVYGSTEVGFIAAECPEHQGLHLLTWKVLVELLGEDGHEVRSGQAGRVVVTDLFNRATPIIRYAGLGDFASKRSEPCTCGKALPLLARIDGRFVDSIIRPDGRVVHPYQLTLALENVPHLAKFQIRQERRDIIRVLLVKDGVAEGADISFDHDSEWGRLILERFGRILGDQVEVELHTVADIARRSGSHKHATVLSLVPEVVDACTTPLPS